MDEIFVFYKSTKSASVESGFYSVGPAGLIKWVKKVVMF